MAPQAPYRPPPIRRLLVETVLVGIVAGYLTVTPEPWGRVALFGLFVVLALWLLWNIRRVSKDLRQAPRERPPDGGKRGRNR